MLYKFCYLFFGLFLLALLAMDPIQANEPVSELSIVYSNDMNGYLEPCG